MSKLGRPSKYNPEMCTVVVAQMAQGASKIEVAAEIGINPDTLHEWCRKDGPYYNESFSDAIKKGELLSRAWWEKQGRINLENGKFNATLWYMNMKNRHAWKDKQDVQHSGTFSVTMPNNDADTL